MKKKHVLFSLLVGAATMGFANAAAAAPLSYDLNNADHIVEGTVENNQLGRNLNIVGDLDGDGFDDYYVVDYEYGTRLDYTVYVYYGSASLSATVDKTQADAVLNTSQSDDYLGADQSSRAGDFDGDGFDDLILTDKGERKAYIVYGSATRLSGNVDLDATAAIVESDDVAGQYIARFVGDLDNDGTDDLVFSRTYNEEEVSELLLVNGSSTQLTGTQDVDDIADATFTANHENNDIGYMYSDDSVTSGDFDGDGNRDFAFHTLTDRQERKATAYVYYNTGTGFSGDYDFNDADFTIQAQRPNFNATRTYEPISAFSMDGDLNGDGVDDIVLGSEAKQVHKGAVHVLYGSTTQLSGSKRLNQMDAEFRGTRYSYLGTSLQMLDVNGDGYDELFMGAPSSPGRVYMVYGGSSQLSGRSQVVRAADTFFVVVPSNPRADNDDYVGNGIAQAGDVNGDGMEDVFVGALGMSLSGLNRTGAAYMVLGTDSTIGTETFIPIGLISTVTKKKNGKVFAEFETGERNTFRLFPNSRKKPAALELDGNLYGSNIFAVSNNGKQLKSYTYLGEENTSKQLRRKKQDHVALLHSSIEDASQAQLFVATLRNGTMRITQFRVRDNQTLKKVDQVTVEGVTVSSFRLVADEENGAINEFEVKNGSDVLYTFSVAADGMTLQ